MKKLKRAVTVDSVVARTNFPRTTVIRVFQELDAANIGTFIIGRKGHPSRLEA